MHSLQEIIGRSGLIRRGDKIILAVSGGIDSMVLLDLLHGMSRQAEITLCIAHFNHRLRGKESDGDEAFVRSSALAYGLECHVRRTDSADPPRHSVQETARDDRYAFFSELRQSIGFDRIATAHHADDNAETILMNFFRGSGARGLSGIPPLREDMGVIRPLLAAFRTDIEAYAAERHIRHREDSSNIKTDYVRNFIRHTLMPQIRDCVNPNLAATVTRNAELFRSLHLHISEEIGENLSSVIIRRNDREMILDLNRLLSSDLFLRESILHRLAGDFSRREIDSGSVIVILGVAEGETGGSAALREGITVTRDRDRLLFLKNPARRSPYRHIVRPGLLYEFDDFSFKAEAVDSASISADPNTEFVDASLLGEELLLRPWREGDWFVPLGMGDRKKLSDFFVDIKVPLFSKNSIPLLVSDGEIVWVCGKRLDDRYKLTGSTSSIMRLRYSSPGEA